MRNEDDKFEKDASISEMREEENKGKGGKLEDQTTTEENGASDYAMNCKSDRDYGSYNSRNI